MASSRPKSKASACEVQNAKVTHVSVFFYKEGHTEIVDISRIYNFNRQNKDDFDRKKKYKLWADDDIESCWHVNILRLGTSFEDMQAPNQERRLRIPNTRNRSFFSDDHNGPVKKSRKRLFRHEEDISKKQQKLLSNRSSILDSDDSTGTDVDGIINDIEEGLVAKEAGQKQSREEGKQSKSLPPLTDLPQVSRDIPRSSSLTSISSRSFTQKENLHPNKKSRTPDMRIRY
ncbi:uncharacterized protein LOC117174878 [Belonocnema kinseyi]|uniref:uncharacterized protein LOC117174878 n=1 Tax=Belonocnema kinseyi TaxID=2817044 RepID=UPI00143D1D0D|nr:uncharacterized protein LOC117174878 [Belonocnema kinseyi]